MSMSAHAGKKPGTLFEPMNRFFFGFNRYTDGVLLDPLSHIYKDATPLFFQRAVQNTLKNLWSPISAINGLLQGNPEKAWTSIKRFLANTIFGFFGIFDMATEMGIEEEEVEDFGQTLGQWGMGSGPYIILPFIGPTTLRDVLGSGVDYFIDPINYYGRMQTGKKYTYTRFGVTLISNRAKHIETLDSLRETSIDYYATMRSLYAQYRLDQMQDGSTHAFQEGPEACIDDESFFNEDLE